MLEKTLAHIGYAMITAASASGITYDNVAWLESTKAGGREISSEPQGELQEEHADGVIVFSHDTNGGYKHNLTLLSALDSVDKDWLGKIELADGSIVEVADGHVQPRFALLVAKELINEDKLYAVDIYYNTTASRYTKSAKSNKPGENIDFEFPQYSLSSRPIETNKVVTQKMYCDTLPTTINLPTLPEPDSEADDAEDDN